jgi:hypothetical protein
MKPDKLKRHIETFRNAKQGRKILNEIRNQRKSFINTTTLSSRALLVSYQVSCRITENKEPHTIAETVILPAEIDMVQTMVSEGRAQQVHNIPLSYNDLSTDC